MNAQDDFRAWFERAPDAMYLHDLSGTLQRVNRAFERVTGFTQDEAIGANIFHLIARGDQSEALRRVLVRLSGGGVQALPVTVFHKSGRSIQLEVTTEVVVEDGQPVAIQGFARDMSEVVTFTRNLQLLHRLSTTNYPGIDDLFADYLSTGCEIFDCDTAIISSVDRQTLKAYGKVDHDPVAAEVAGQRRTIVIEENDSFYLGTPILTGDAVFGVISFRREQSKAARRPHPQSREVLELMAKSIAAAIHQRQLTDKLEHQAHHDALTGLPNRLMLQRRLDSSLSYCRRTGSSLAVLFLDLDRFKQINDTLGHGIGDQVLQQIASRLRKCMHAGDTLARMGGDEFTAILGGGLDESDLAEYAGSLMAAVRTPCRAAGRELFVTASVGISRFPQDGMDAATLLRNADSAMYTAKNRANDDLHFFMADSSGAADRLLEMETHLRRALERNEFVLQYQPQVDLNGKLASLEALLVWDSPKLGRISPADFIPIAEETGMIVPIGAWVLGQASAQMALWRAAGLDPVPLAVNVSALQFAEPDFVSTVADAFSRAQVPAEAFELELTESLIMRDVEASAQIMSQLREIGVKIAIDDFGTGYSSLSYLRRLPANSLKIDRSFLEESDFAPAALALMRPIVVLAHNIGLSVTAEGVETAAQFEIIRQAGCDKVQGHLFGCALSAAAVGQLLQERAGQ